jgi:hypothetical protein
MLPPENPFDLSEGKTLRKRSIMLTSVGAGVLALIVAAPAVAAPTDSTPITFAVTAGSLDIDAPTGPVALGSAPPGGSTTSTPLGVVAVSDTRGGATSAWIAEAYATDFTLTDAPTIPSTAMAYWSGPALTDPAPTGGGTFIPGQPTLADRVPLPDNTDDAVQVFQHTGGTGGSTVSWNPELVVTIPITAPAGTYGGTVTHQVA